MTLSLLLIKNSKNQRFFLIRDVIFFQKLASFEVDIQMMSSVLQHQREKINEILQIFENFADTTQETITNNEQMKKKEAERNVYMENYQQEFESGFSQLEGSLKKALQEKENVLGKINTIFKAQKNLQENKEIILNSLMNQV